MPSAGPKHKEESTEKRKKKGNIKYYNGHWLFRLPGLRVNRFDDSLPDRHVQRSVTVLIGVPKLCECHADRHHVP